MIPLHLECELGSLSAEFTMTQMDDDHVRNIQHFIQMGHECLYGGMRIDKIREYILSKPFDLKNGKS